jgi:class 3 adenylate cyclase
LEIRLCVPGDVLRQTVRVVVDPPETNYARSSDGTNLAYQVSGAGPLELVFLHVAYPIELLSEDPGFARLRRRLDTFSRSVWFDARGNGMSEGNFQDTQRQEIFDSDLTAVVNAAGFERPALVAEGFPGLGAIRFTVAQTERVSSLVLINSYAHYLRGEDYPWGIPPQDIEATIALTKESWGTSAAVPLLAPSRAGDERFRAWYARAARFTGGPDLVAGMIRAGLEADVRPLLSSVSVPTLVLHREGNLYIDPGAGRYLAEHIPDARFVVLPGDEHLFFAGDTDALADEIEEFLTGARSGAESDVVMAAVLFTDIVASTEHQARVGSREWSRLTDRHDAMVRATLTRHSGREVKTTGDGFLVTFDTPGKAIRCAEEILSDARGIGLMLRAGVHTGEVERRGDDIAGLSVNIASRVCALAGPGEVLVTETIRLPMVGSAMSFEDRGEHELKGVPGNWRLFVAIPRDPERRSRTS